LILRLGELLRKVLSSTDQQEVALADELEFIKAYLDIEQMRLGNRLNVEWDIAEDVLDVKVPALLLQPLVENAVQHGIAAATRPGTVQILAQLDDGFLRLQVRDTGPGLDQHGEAAKSGVGLANTKARLETIFGDRHTFDLVNDPGLSVTLRLPMSMLTSGEKPLVTL
jgi:sensor histidine kinase YesM